MGDTPEQNTAHNAPAPGLTPPIAVRRRLVTADHWFHARHELYQKVSQYGIPKVILDIVQVGHPEARVEWVDSDGNVATYGQHQFYKVYPPARSFTDWFLGSVAERWKVPPSAEAPSTAGELLAAMLRGLLREYQAGRAANKRGKKAPIRSRGSELMPQPLIADVASDLLEDCRFAGYAPGPHLVALIEELLGTDRPELGGDRDFTAKDRAAWILAEDSSIGDRELGRRVGVQHTTVAKWRQDEKFQKWVQDRQRLVLIIKERRERLKGSQP